MYRKTYTSGIGIGAAAMYIRRLGLAALILATAGCAAPVTTDAPEPAPLEKSVQHRSSDISIRLVGILRAGDKGTLVLDPGWREYIFAIENTGKRTLTVQNLKLLNRDGRYIDSASSYEQVIVPPDTASKVAGSVATRAAGVAAGQAIPYGGSLVGIISSAVSASAAENAASAKREFENRKLKNIELAPKGKVTGSAFLPRISNAKALVVDYGHGKVSKRIEIPLPSTGS